jgi:PAS domain S-box-containing protein
MVDSTQPALPRKNIGLPRQGKPLAAKPAEILVVGGEAGRQIPALDPSIYHFNDVDDPASAMQMLNQAQYDLLMLDDTLYGEDTAGVVREIKRRIPLIPIAVMSNKTDTIYRTDLMEAGADNVLSYDQPAEELHRRLSLMLKQHAQNRALARRNQNLHAITLLSRRLHSAADPHSLILETIDLACSTFRLYGLAIVLEEGNRLRMYAGLKGISEYGRLSETTIQPQKYDPFRRCIDTGIVQIFEDITADFYYGFIPVLPDAESAIILPLKYQDYTVGALGVFAPRGQTLDSKDLIIYELFAAQFVVALNNVRHYQTQSINVQSSQHLLRAWQSFIALHSFDDVARTLRELVEDMATVGQAIVWLYRSDSEQMSEVTVNAQHQETIQTFLQLYDKGLIRKIIDQFNERLQPISLFLGRGQQNPLGPLFRSLQGQQLLVLPVTDSTRLIGGMIASAGGSQQFSIEDANLMESLAHAAGQALERATLINAMREQSGRLEAILRSIYEGIFFVEDSGKVAFCNPQFTELTGINPSEVLGRDPEVLLAKLANLSGDNERVRGQFYEAIQTMLNTEEKGQDYPIVEMRHTTLDRTISIEFVMIDGLNRQNGSWVGIIRDSSNMRGAFKSNLTQLLDAMAERIRLPYAQLRSTISTLAEEHSHFSHRERDMMLQQLERSAETIGQLWDNFLETYNLEERGTVLNREDVNLPELVERIINNRPFNRLRRKIVVEAAPELPPVKIDVFYIQQTIANILQNAIQYSSNASTITVSFGQEGHEVLVAVHDHGIGIPADQLETIFEPFYRATNNLNGEGAGLGLYLARELVRRHGGRIWAESALGQGTVVAVALPAAVAPELPAVRPERPMETVAEVVEESPQAAASRVPNRAPQTIMVVAGHSSLITFLSSRLESQGYKILSYKSGEEALRDIKLTRLDLILLDVKLPDANGVDLCERMRKRTEVPIILLAEEASDPEKVRGLNAGADDYIAKPISQEELMARVNVIFKRQQIPDRTREPLDLGDLYVDFARREVFLNGKPMELTRIEYDLLHTLAINMGQVLTHKQLLDKVWGPEYQGETQYLWVNVSRLRKKLEPSASSTRYIHNVPGIGYVFRKP